MVFLFVHARGEKMCDRHLEPVDGGRILFVSWRDVKLPRYLKEKFQDIGTVFYCQVQGECCGKDARVPYLVGVFTESGDFYQIRGWKEALRSEGFPEETIISVEEYFEDVRSAIGLLEISV